MKEIDVQNKELIVRKRTSAFLEKALIYRGYDFRHDDYKQIIYGEIGVRTPFEETVKNAYDAYWYLLTNAKNPLSTDVLKRFFYILDGKETDESALVRLATNYFNILDKPSIERAVEFHLFVYDEFRFASDDFKLIVPLMFFNYALVSCGFPTVRFIPPALKEYERVRDEYFKGNKANVYEFFLEQLRLATYQDKVFYKNLKPLSTSDVCKRILNDEEMLKTRYGVKSVSIFGSFAKNLQRIDSDVDLLAVFSRDLSFDEKKRISEELENYYKKVFNRFIDINEISEYVGDWIIKEITNYKKIF